MFNILLVDDSTTVRAVIGKTLRLAGVEYDNIYEAANGEEGLKVIEDEWVDLVFLDISMPVMDGEEMTARMNEEGTIEQIPVVVVSSAGSEPRVARMKANGVKDYVQKPFTPERIREVVDKIMGVTR